VNKIDNAKIIGKMTGIIAGKVKQINLKKYINGSPLFKDKSINCTLLLNEKIEIINKNNNMEFATSCLRTYFSINFIDIFLL
tara:strand:+ start:635 stop:880 length:246 start_codon:yes stop_codon:yes gene_type:complete